MAGFLNVILPLGLSAGGRQAGFRSVILPLGLSAGAGAGGFTHYGVEARKGLQEENEILAIIMAIYETEAL